MSLYTRFQDEAQFREGLVKPLLNRLGYYGVSELHGTQEFGKDFVFSELHRLGGFRHYAAQVKHEKKIRQGASVDGLLSQVRQAFATPFKRADSPRECHVSAVYVFNSGEITDGAREYLLSAVGREHFGDNVHFLDGERLEALNEWASLQSDANARARLLGLRTALQFIIKQLHEIAAAEKPSLQPTFLRGIELYLSEPVVSVAQLVPSLLTLWETLQAIDQTSKMMFRFSTDKTFWGKNVPALKDFADRGIRRATSICEAVDDSIAKMKPLAAA